MKKRSDLTAERRHAFGIALREARARRGLSQRQLGIRLGVVPGAVTAWEGGDRTPYTDTVFRAEEVLDVPAGTLSRRLGYLPLRALAQADPTVEQAVAADPALDPPGKQAVLAVYRALADPRLARRD